MGAFHFVAVNQHNKSIEEGEGKPIKPIIGITLNVCKNHLDRSHRDDGHQIVLIAKNKRLSQPCKTDIHCPHQRVLLRASRRSRYNSQLQDDLMVLTGIFMGGALEVLNVGAQQAEESYFGGKGILDPICISSLCVTIRRMRHESIRPWLKWRKHNVKIIATNSCYYLKKEEANAHDILLCVKEGEKQSTPIGRGQVIARTSNQEYYFKSPQQMSELFSDLPEAIHNIKKSSKK